MGRNIFAVPCVSDFLCARKRSFSIVRFNSLRTSYSSNFRREARRPRHDEARELRSLSCAATDFCRENARTYSSRAPAWIPDVGKFACGSWIFAGPDHDNPGLSIGAQLPTWQWRTPGITSEMLYIATRLANQIRFHTFAESGYVEFRLTFRWARL